MGPQRSADRPDTLFVEQRVVVMPLPLPVGREDVFVRSR